MPRRSGSLATSGRFALSTEQLLSLAAGGVVLAVMTVGVVATWLTLTRSAVADSRDRLSHGVRQLANVSATSVRQSTSRFAAVAANASVREALTTAAPDSAVIARAQAALLTLRTPTDSGVPIELWRADGRRRVALVGDDLDSTAALRLPGETQTPPTAVRPGLDSIAPIDSVQLGRLYTVGGRTYLWSAMPVSGDRGPIGFILKQTRVATNAQTERTLRELSGDSVTGYYRNVDGSGWTTFGGMPASPPQITKTGRARAGAGELLFAEERIAGTPLMLVMEIPKRIVIASAAGAVRQLTTLAVVLTLLAAALAWWTGRRVARPLMAIVDAVEGVAGGDYQTRVDGVGTRETISLAASFNRMAARIGESRQELEQRENDLRALAIAAEAASRAKSDFLAAMSHELRTPLNAIGGYAELMEMGVRGPITEAQRRDLTRIRLSQEHLLGLIGGILDLSRIESGRLHYELADIALDAVFSDMEALTGPQAEAKGHQLHFEPTGTGLIVRADREKLRQILLNLLSNAVRHTPPGSTIRVEASAHAKGMVRITVADTGGGIAPDAQAAIFEPFVQLDRTLTSTTEGVGLGLAISRDLARGMGGELTVSSTPGAGATFMLDLPAGTLNDATVFKHTSEMAATQRGRSA
jgi:signal transduction histidine kinase